MSLSTRSSFAVLCLTLPALIGISRAHGAPVAMPPSTATCADHQVRSAPAAESANWLSIAMRIADKTACGMPLDPKMAEAAIQGVREEGKWFDEMFGKNSAPEPGKESKILTVEENGGKITVAIVISSHKDGGAVAVVKGRMVMGSSIFDILHAAPVGAYDSNEPDLTDSHRREIFQNAIAALERRNDQFERKLERSPTDQSRPQPPSG